MDGALQEFDLALINTDYDLKHNDIWQTTST